MRLGADRLQRDAARGFSRDLPRNKGNGMTQGRSVHIVEKQVRRACRQRRLDLINPIDFDHDRRDPSSLGASRRLAHRSRDRDMIVLDHGCIPQAHPMVCGAAHPRRVFFQHAKTRNRLARVKQRAARPGYCLDKGARHRCDARQMLNRVERRPFRSQHRARISRKSHQVGARAGELPLSDQQFDFNRRVQRAKERLGNPQARHDNGVAAVHHACKARRYGNDGLRSHIARRVAQVLGQCGGDESIKVKTQKIEAHAVVRGFILTIM